MQEGGVPRGHIPIPRSSQKELGEWVRALFSQVVRMTNAEFLVFLYELRLAGKSPAKWCRQTTIEKWDSIEPYLTHLDDAVSSLLLSLAKSILP